MSSCSFKSLDDYINRIHEEYVKARKPICDAEGHIERGRSRTISGIAEDLFAALLQSELKDESLHFFIDQPLSYGNGIVYPDISICKMVNEKELAYEVLFMLDLKMDVGYHRYTAGKSEDGTYVQKAEELIDKCYLLKEHGNFSITSRSGINKKSKTSSTEKKYCFAVNKNASYDMVVVTSENAGSKKNTETLCHFSDDLNKNIWVLCDGDHPNEYKKEFNYQSRDTNWKQLLNKIWKICERDAGNL